MFPCEVKQNVPRRTFLKTNAPENFENFINFERTIFLLIFIAIEQIELGNINLWRPHGRAFKVGGLETCHIFEDSIFSNNRSIVHFGDGWGSGGSKNWSFFVGVINGLPL